LGLVREADTVARLSGDEFAICLADLGQDHEAGLLAAQLVAAFNRPFTIDARPVFLTASIGISLFPQDGTDVDTLMSNADAAMCQAKDEGRDTFRLYSAELAARTRTLRGLEADLRRAAANQELILYYQPQIDLDTGRVAGAEALIRWRHPELGLLEPARFIPLAESTGLIFALTTWVLGTAGTQMKAWRDQGLLTDGTVWVNLSNRDLQDPNLAETIATILREIGLAPAALGVEIAQTWAVANPEVAARSMLGLHSLGIAVGIDYLGTGYSPQAPLSRLPVRVLKIGRSFVAGIPWDPQGCAMARAVIALGRALGLRVVATGVETPAQEDFLRDEGCRIGQGYLFSPPLPAVEFALQVRGRMPPNTSPQSP
jgi:predicted signal transduction protein with EAL and GGDEF domain